MHSPPAKYLIVIDAGGSMVARLFDAQRRPLGEFDASSEEVAVMTSGLAPQRSGLEAGWAQALAGHNPDERAAAEIYTLDV
ncbi:MAG: hypothetical protein KIT35_11865 [Piscinibacter sp.]|uniref:hypothetical protein n=1 Tax=Piscinibacter sp. TaxID=1903157 RepID=UPI002585C066|nr:hypothetical protein [Piscinibacter sp.]MCW5664523.1 hypothetical protein [Piscinibacter sp.]